MKIPKKVIAFLLLVLVSSAFAEIAVKDGEKIAFLGDSITLLGIRNQCGYVNLVMDGLARNGVKAVMIPAGFSGNKSNQMLARLQRELDKRIDEVAKQELAAMDLIDVLDTPRQRELLGYRYLNGWAWKEIAQRMGYSMDWVKHMHANAVRELEMLKDGE